MCCGENTVQTRNSMIKRAIPLCIIAVGKRAMVQMFYRVAMSVRCVIVQVVTLNTGLCFRQYFLDVQMLHHMESGG